MSVDAKLDFDYFKCVLSLVCACASSQNRCCMFSHTIILSLIVKMSICRFKTVGQISNKAGQKWSGAKSETSPLKVSSWKNKNCISVVF